MPEPADVIIRSRSLFTSETLEPMEGAIIVSEKRIVDVVAAESAESYIGPNTIVFDCGDRTVVPAFNDAHTHFLFAGIQANPDYTLDLSGCKSEHECVKRIEEFATAHPDNAWIYGCGWNHEQWGQAEFPTKELLDEILPSRPAFFVSWDLHTGWTNSKGLECAGYTDATPNPPGAIIGRYETGELNGLVREPAAVDPIQGMAIGAADMKSVLEKSFDDALSNGIASVSIVWPFGGMSERQTVEVFQKAEREDALPIRVHFFPKLEQGLQGSKAFARELSSDHLRFAGVKQITDGVCESHTGYLTEPYADDPHETGTPIIGREELEELIGQADEQGFSVRLHCIGNGAVRQALDAHEAVQKKHGKKGLHHTIEHIETCSSDDIPRFAALNITASMQPIHAVLNIDGYPQLLGEQWRNSMWPIRSLLDAGTMMAFGTDYPVWGLNPMEGLYAAIERKQPWDGYPDGGFVPSQRISLGEALQAYTFGAAYAENFEHEAGTLRAGKLADIVILDRNIFEATPDEVLKTKVLVTLIDGKAAYQAEAAAEIEKSAQL